MDEPSMFGEKIKQQKEGDLGNNSGVGLHRWDREKSLS